MDPTLNPLITKTSLSDQTLFSSHGHQDRLGTSWKPKSAQDQKICPRLRFWSGTCPFLSHKGAVPKITLILKPRTILIVDPILLSSLSRLSGISFSPGPIKLAVILSTCFMRSSIPRWSEGHHTLMPASNLYSPPNLPQRNSRPIINWLINM